MNFVKRKIKNLIKKINFWDYLYYIKSNPQVSNEEYDRTLQKLYQLEKNYPNLVIHSSPTQCINLELEHNFHKIRHKSPMLSLNSTVNVSQIYAFDKRIKLKLDNQNIIRYCCEFKIDGVAASLLYEQGKLVYAATRGNGQIGEDITRNIRTIHTIPSFLNFNNHKRNSKIFPDLLEVRGEVFISNKSFQKLNKLKKLNKNKIFSNPRNAASGILRTLNVDHLTLNTLNFCCYGISYYHGLEILPDSHWRRLRLCKSWGLPISNAIKLISNIYESLEYYEYVQSERSNLDFEIDGIVIKVDSCRFQKKLGVGRRTVNWAIAYKFPAEIRYTKIYDLVFKVGRTGIITPIAYLEPINISNVVIKKVNMHSINIVKKLNLMIGDTVRLQRSGDVIPKILGVVFSKRPIDAKPIKFPYFCPECGSVLNMWKGQFLILRCISGLSCIAQRKAWLKHFASKKAMNIYGAGDKVVNNLVDHNLLYNPVDFYHLDLKRLCFLKGYNIKSAESLLIAIEQSKKVTLARFIYALGIYSVGETVSYNLANMFKTIDNFLSMDFELLFHSKCIGKVVATNIYDFFHHLDNLKNIYDLINPKIGIRFISVV